MRTATTIEASAGKQTVEFAVEAEKLGLDICWVAEAWGADAPSPLGYLAARTESMLLGSGVIQVGTRSPVTIAQTAMTLAHLSGGRFLLGLGVSGPQVIEGLHGIPFGHPLARMRETVAIVRRVFTGEKVSFAGSQYRIPLEGRPMRVSLPPISVPVYLASLSPRMLELTGEIADGWLGTSFVPEGADAYFTHLDAGLARAGRRRADLDICQGAEIDLVEEADLATTVAGRKKELAFWTPCACTRPETPWPPAWTTSAGASTSSGVWGRQAVYWPGDTRWFVADVQIHVEPSEAQQPPDDGLAAGDDQFTAVPGLDFMGPYQDGKGGAVDEAECGQVRHQGLRRGVQGVADGSPQVVRAADVKLALEPHP